MTQLRGSSSRPVAAYETSRLTSTPATMTVLHTQPMTCHIHAPMVVNRSPTDWNSGTGCPPTSHLLDGANLQAVRKAIVKRSPRNIGGLPERPPRRSLHEGLLATPTKNVLLGSRTINGYESDPKCQGAKVPNAHVVPARTASGGRREYPLGPGPGATVSSCSPQLD